MDNSLRESVKLRYLCSNIRTFLSNFVATDVYALLLKSYPEDFRPILSWASSNPILGRNLSSTPVTGPVQDAGASSHTECIACVFQGDVQFTVIVAKLLATIKPNILQLINLRW